MVMERFTLMAAVLALGVHSLTPADDHLIRLTKDGHLKQRPAWSPDGQWLAFSRHRGDKIFIHVCKADGSPEWRLTKRNDPEYDAVWSPDGKRLAFSFVKTSPNQGDVEVYTISADGEDPQPVAATQ